MNDLDKNRAEQFGDLRILDYFVVENELWVKITKSRAIRVNDNCKSNFLRSRLVIPVENIDQSMFNRELFE